MNTNNMLPNGDFETAPASPGVWNTSLRWIYGTDGGYGGDKQYIWYVKDQSSGQNGGSWQFDKTVKYSGTASLKLTNKVNTGLATAESASVPAKESTYYRLTARVKVDTNLPANSVCMKVQIYDTRGGTATKQFFSPKIADNTTWVDWDILTLDFLTTEYTDYIKVTPMHTVAGQIGSAWFDEITLVKLGDPVVPGIPFVGSFELGNNAPFDIAATGVGQPVIDKLNAYCDKMVALGSKWVRASFVGAYIHGTAGGSYIYNAYDQFVNTVIAKGLTPVAIVNCSSGAAGTQEFSDYFQTIATHFAPLGLHHYEYLNEKNLLGAYNTDADPAHYALGLAPMYDAIKLGDPTAKVLFSGLTGGSVGSTNPGPGQEYSAPEFLAGVYAAGAGSKYDIMNMHAYGHTWYVFQKVREVMLTNGDKAKKMWITEDGIPTWYVDTNGMTQKPTRSVPEWKQAAYFEEAIKFVQASGYIEKYFIYNGADSGGTPTDRESHFGVTTGPLLAMVNKSSFDAIIYAKASV